MCIRDRLKIVVQTTNNVRNTNKQVRITRITIQRP
jgi:hypothetical protein